MLSELSFSVMTEEKETATLYGSLFCVSSSCSAVAIFSLTAAVLWLSIGVEMRLPTWEGKTAPWFMFREITQ